MLLAILFFVMGSPGYVHVPPTESPMIRVVKVVHAAIQNRFGLISPSLPEMRFGMIAP